MEARGPNPETRPREIRLSLLPEPESVLQARRSLDELDTSGLRLTDDLLSNARLLTSELVTNSVRHAGLGPEDRITLLALVSPVLLRVEVWDDGPGFTPPNLPQSDLPGPAEPGGYGLRLVGALSDRWGVETGVPVCVWFEAHLE